MPVSEDFKRKIYAVRDLPTLPIIAQKILTLRNDDENLAEKLGRIISSDQSLSVKVLTLANSAYYGHRAQVGTIKKAVVVIGTAMLRQFSLGVLVAKGLGSGTQEREAFWRHSLMAANAAATLSKRSRTPNPEICFMGGLLHDIGKLVLDTNMPAEYKQVMEMVKSGSCSSIEAERLVLDTDHTEVGAWMAERWQLPAELVQSIGFHHSLEYTSQPQSRIVAIVSAASLCADAAEQMETKTLDEPQLAMPLEIESTLGLSRMQFLDVVRDLHINKGELQGLFN
jgi:putative nucleotidyltransferase with HDIG domain